MLELIDTEELYENDNILVLFSYYVQFYKYIFAKV